MMRRCRSTTRICSAMSYAHVKPDRTEHRKTQDTHSHKKEKAHADRHWPKQYNKQTHRIWSAIYASQEHHTATETNTDKHKHRECDMAYLGGVLSSSESFCDRE